MAYTVVGYVVMAYIVMAYNTRSFDPQHNTATNLARHTSSASL